VSFRVEVRRSAEKELGRLSEEIRTRISKALLNLAEQPFPAGVKKLHGSDGYRIRVGDYRILYTVDAGASVVTISAIGHRSDVYR
jgi:mRNA interferase RelE/StbE